MTRVTVSSKGQIAIPKAIREKLGWEQGNELELRVEDGQVVIGSPPAGLEDWRSMRGMAKGGPSLTRFVEAERAAEVAQDEARAMRLRRAK